MDAGRRGGQYGSGVGVTGLIFAVIAALWLMYLVPYFLRHRSADAVDDALDAAIPFAHEVTIVRSGTSLAEAEEGAADISTPLTRRAQLRELQQVDAQAAHRRRRVLMFLLIVQILAAVLAVFQVGSWWAVLIPAALIAAFVGVARFSVRTMRANLAERARAIRECGDEETMVISLTAIEDHDHEHSIELSTPIARLGSLWDPIPITRPTYVSKPLAPRTVRTIDLSAPVAPAPRIPVTADPIQTPSVDEPGAEEGVG